jgi:hypothetical protein
MYKVEGYYVLYNNSVVCIGTEHRYFTRLYSSIPLCLDLYTLVVLPYVY